MTQEEFVHRFVDEHDCKLYWKQMREQEGLICVGCKGNSFRWHSGQYRWICKGCKKSFSLRSGTVMQDSNLPFRIWLKAMNLMTVTKKSISALELQRQLGLKRYEPALYMMGKLRSAMGDRDGKYELEGNVELDDGFITVIKPKQEEVEAKRGRGSKKKHAILVMVSFNKSDINKKNRPNTIPGYLKLYAMNDLKAESVSEAVFDGVKTSKTCLKSDGYGSFRKLKKFVRKHNANVVHPTEAHIHLPWVHCTIGNLKRIIDGIHHHINQENLQLYLDEFAYKFNRRFFKSIFERLVIAGIHKSWA